jgi:hypothetical protein
MKGNCSGGKNKNNTIIIDCHLLAISLCTMNHRKIMQGIRNAVFVHQNGF